MTQHQARMQGDKKQHLEFAGFKFYQVDDREDDSHAKWIVLMPNGNYLTKAYVHLATALNAAERQINKALFLYRNSINISEDWQAAVRRYEGNTEL